MMAADHHGHGHAAPVEAGAWVFALAVLLNLGYLVLEAVVGLAIGSLALLADAAHNLIDVATLLIAWGAAAAAKLGPRGRFSWGFGRGTILAALASGLAVLVGAGAVAWEAAGRFAAPPEVPGLTMAAVATAGIAVNAGTAWLFAAAAKSDLNARGAWLHLAADAAVSAAVVVSALVMVATGARWIDPAAAILIGLVVAWSALGLLREALARTLDATPADIDADAVRGFLAGLPGVADVHDLHVWPLSASRAAMSAHLVIPGGHPGDFFIASAAEELREHHRIDHATLQIEIGDGATCERANGSIVKETTP